MKLNKGYTLMHEHITLDLSSIKHDPDTHLNCKNETIREFKKLYAYGVRNIVEVTNIGMGRNISYIKEVEEATGIQIIISTGLYKDPFIPENMALKSVKELADIMISDIEHGIEQGSEYANVIGEIGTSKNEWTENERKVFDAAIIAHKKTGRAISTHTTLSTLALEQATYLIENGVDPKRVVIGHIDLSGDLNAIKKVLHTGVNVAFDTIGKIAYLPDETRVIFLMELEKLGYLNQVVLSEDLTRESHLEYKGGIGYSYLFERFIPMLKKQGMKEESIHQMLVLNPKRILEEPYVVF